MLFARGFGETEYILFRPVEVLMPYQIQQDALVVHFFPPTTGVLSLTRAPHPHAHAHTHKDTPKQLALVVKQWTVCILGDFCWGGYFHPLLAHSPSSS